MPSVRKESDSTVFMEETLFFGLFFWHIMKVKKVRQSPKTTILLDGKLLQKKYIFYIISLFLKFNFISLLGS